MSDCYTDAFWEDFASHYIEDGMKKTGETRKEVWYEFCNEVNSRCRGSYDGWYERWTDDFDWFFESMLDDDWDDFLLQNGWIDEEEYRKMEVSV